MYCYTQCPQPCSRPPPTHTSTRDSWMPTGKSGAVSYGVTTPFLWVLVHKVLLCPLRIYFPLLCKFLQLCGGVNGNLLQKGLCHTQVCCTQSLCPCSRPLLTHMRYKPNPGWIRTHLNGAFLVAQMVKNLLAMQETQIPSLGWEDTWRREYPLQYSCLENLMNNGA